MQIIRLFRKEMNDEAKPAEQNDQVEELRRSLRRRDRRIAELKRKLRETRDSRHGSLRDAHEIIRGLEQALMMHTPRTDESGDDRIAELEAELSAMTEFAETLQQRASL